MPYFHPQRELKIPLIPFISAVCEEECATTFFDFHSESFCAALLHVQSNKAPVIYQPVSTLTKVLPCWTGRAGPELLAEHNKSRQVLTRQKFIFFSHLFSYSTIAL